MPMLEANETMLVVVDVQERLMAAMHEPQRVEANVARLLDGAAAIGLPVLVTEQNPSRLGPSIEAVRSRMTDAAIEKMAFGCCGEPAFVEAVRARSPGQVLLCGIEAHVCVHQTAMQLRSLGIEVHVAVDAVSSRNADHVGVIRQRWAGEGICVTCVETALFELLGVAEGEAFKKVLKIVK